jgi:hypothetical protein
VAPLVFVDDTFALKGGTAINLFVCNDRFGHPVQPEEWFLVPLFVIDEAVARIKDGSITGYIYDPSAAKLVKA